MLVLVDWEVSDNDLKRVVSAYGEGGEKAVFRMDKAHADVSMGDDFRGIERFYPAALVARLIASGDLTAAQDKAGTYCVTKAKLDSVKSLMREQMEKESAPDAFRHLAKVVIEAQQRIDDVLQDQRSKFGVSVSASIMRKP